MPRERWTEPGENSKLQFELGESGRKTIQSSEQFHSVLQLQRTLGNRLVAELIQAKRLTPQGKILTVRPKLAVGAADDQYEKQADDIANQVVSVPDPALRFPTSIERGDANNLQSKPLAASITPLGGGSVEENDEPEDKKSAGPSLETFEAGATVEAQLGLSKGHGSPLPNAVRTFMEPRFGADFSQVRVHTGSDAVQMNRDLGAQTFTHGSDIYFGASQGPSDRGLVAHELTHVVQQGQAKIATVQREPEKPIESKRGAHADARLNGLNNRLSEVLQVLPDSYDPKLLGELRELDRRVKTVRENFKKGLIPAADAEYAADKDEERLRAYLANDPALETLGRMDTDFIRTNRSALRSALVHGATRAAEIKEIFAEGQRPGTSANVKEPGDLIPSSELERDVLTELGVTEPSERPGGAPMPERFDVGNFGHTNAEKLIPDLPSGLDKNVVIHLDDGTVRIPDRVQWNDPSNKSKGGTVFEIKPDTAAWRQKGQKQAELYAHYLSDLYGGKFEAKVLTYNRQAVRDFVRDLRAAPGTPATHQKSPFVEEPNAREGTAKAPGGTGGSGGSVGRGGASGVTATSTEPSGYVPLERPPPVTARDLAVEMRQTETTNRRMATAATVARYALEAYSLFGVVEQIASSINLATTTLAGGPLQKEKQQAIAAAVTATQLADYYESLDLRKNIPPGGWEAFDGGWSALQQIQFDYYETESHLHAALESVDAALKNIGSQIQDLADLITKMTSALVLTPVSTPYGEVVLFANDAGQVRSHLIDAANAYARAHRAIYSAETMAQASIKYIEIRLRQLGVTGLVNANIDTADLKTAPLGKFTERQYSKPLPAGVKELLEIIL